MKNRNTDSMELAKKIRLHALEMVHHAHASHIGSILSVADIIAVLYADVLNIDCENPHAGDRDRFVLSKGHAGVAVYAALAESGFFPADMLRRYGEDGSPFSCHISHKHVPGVEVSAGSLGHGCGIACGIALHAKRRLKNYKVYAVIGDGECNEGTVWEMAAFASQQGLDNFTVVTDRNQMQAMGLCRDIMDMEPLAAKWRDFGWTACDVGDGHNHDQLREAFQKDSGGKPKAVIAHTVKGKGVSFMEHQLLWHYRDPQGSFYEQAYRELKGESF